MGNLTRDPETKYLPSGTAVCEVGLAVNEVWKDKQGDKQEKTLFADVTFFGRSAEVCGEHLRKGSLIHVEGKLQLDVWEDKTSGQKRSKLKVIGERMTMLGSKSAPRGEESQVPPERDEAEDIF